MPDFRAIGFAVGLIVTAVGGLMLIPMGLDASLGNGGARVFLQGALVSIFCGGLVALACGSRSRAGPGLRHSFALIGMAAAVVPLFCGLPFVLSGATAHATDAYFEAVSGLTTTGTTMLRGLDRMPEGLLLWRGMLNWVGGFGVVLAALTVMPALRIGGLGLIRADAVPGGGRIGARLHDRVWRQVPALAQLYLGLTVACGLVYLGMGMSGIEAAVHAMATISTGGFSTRDASFADFGAGLQYAAVLFMVLASLPFVRLIQASAGTVQPLWRDPQARVWLGLAATAVAGMVIYRSAGPGPGLPEAGRTALFTVVSVLSGTGFALGNVTDWGPFAVMVVFALGLVGGCAPSPSGAIGMFRVMILTSAVQADVARSLAPSRVVSVSFDGQRVGQPDLDQIILYLCGFVGLGLLLGVALAMTGLDMTTAIFAIWASLCNLGFAFGPGLPLSTAPADLPEAAKWLLIAAMLMGRLGFLAVMVLGTVRFWQD